ncbi:MAG: dTDP-glucose 4,6-dehydratase [Actinomycetota bacterium]
MTEPSKVLVTGGAGFIGSHLVDALLEAPNTSVTVLDKLTYAGNRVNLETHDKDDRFSFVLGDIADPEIVAPLVAGSDRVVHAAAESFVDRSISDAAVFLESNVIGTQVVLEACRATGRPLLFVSTDEVYGSNDGDNFSEDDALRPRSPYAASKAAADLLCGAYAATYAMPVAIARGTNAFGPRQHPEKAIPTFALAALENREVPVYGDGSNRREWLHVRDWVSALLAVMERGDSNGVYNIGGGFELPNLELARQVCSLSGAHESIVSFVQDRPGHDFRYGVDWGRLKDLGWSPSIDFSEGLAETVGWYREHGDWARAMLERANA